MINGKCSGCGALIQSSTPQKAGFVPVQLQVKQVEKLLCQRCYRIRHYSEIKPIEQSESDFAQVFRQIEESESLVVFIIDLFDFTGSLIPGIHRHIGRNPLYLLANKIDLFPKSTKEEKLSNSLKRSLQSYGIHPIGINFISAEKGWQIQEAWSAIEALRGGRDVYVVGTANVGKSTFINRLLPQDQQITTSRYPGTTLDTIQLPLPDGKMIIDTPGILRKDRLSEWMTPEELKIVMPNKRLKPRGYQLNDQQTLFLGGLIRLDYVRGKKQPFVCYLSNLLPIHRTKLINAEHIQNHHLGDWLVPPYDRSRLPQWIRHRIHLSGNEKEDIVMTGLGFIATGKEKAMIELWAPKGIQVGTRPSILS